MAISSTSSASAAGFLSAPGGQGAVSANSLAADARSLGALKAQAGKDSPAAVKETAKQLESLFMRELMKSMREATMKSGLTDNEGTAMGTDLLDQQFSVQMSGQRGGLSDMIAKQLSRQTASGGDADKPMDFKVPSTLSLGRFGAVGEAGGAAAAAAAAPAQRVRTAQTQAGFVEQHSGVAARVAQDSGIPAAFMMGQAGHETGWGRSEIRMKDGGNSHNLFGIKAGAGWTGKVAEVTTTEYIGGKAQKVTAKFRAYDSYEDSFRDYARLINDNPRYATARQSTGSAVAYATELKRAGYATDPAYASKLSRAIHSTMQLQRTQAQGTTVAGGTAA